MDRRKELQEYLDNKHKGGENNQKGSHYEDFYAVYRIVLCIAQYKDLYNSIDFQTQLADTFVDDLLIALPSMNVYHQLKNTKEVKWGDPDIKGTIAFDFAHQIEECKNRDEAFALKLVYSAVGSDVAKEIPKRIQPYSSTEYFRYEDDLNKLVWLSNDLQIALQSISPLGKMTPMDMLINIAMGFLGAWKSGDAKQKICLNDVISKVDKLKEINLSIWPNAAIGEQCKSILDQLNDLKYNIIGKNFYWTVGKMKGDLPWSQELEDKIIAAHPITNLELITLLLEINCHI